MPSKLPHLRGKTICCCGHECEPLAGRPLRAPRRRLAARLAVLADAAADAADAAALHLRLLQPPAAAMGPVPGAAGGLMQRCK